MTYIPTWAGFLYLAMVLDVFSRRVVGWALGEQMTAELLLSALNMAIQQYKPGAVIHHSDQGSTPALPLANAAGRWACVRQWVQSAMAKCLNKAALIIQSPPQMTHRMSRFA